MDGLFAEAEGHHPPPPSSEEEGALAASASEIPCITPPLLQRRGLGGGASPQASTREVMLSRAAAMRRAPTEPEHQLWLALRHSRLGGHKFRRQATIGGRIADFFCPAKGVIIEIDGETHDRERDLQRDTAMRKRTGFVTLRFTNGQVMGQREEVLQAILLTLEGRGDRWVTGRSTEGKEGHHPPTPSSEEEGE